MSLEWVLGLTVWVPLVGALLVIATGRWPNLRETMTLGAAVALFALVLRLLGEGQGGTPVAVVLAEPIPGLPLALAVEPLGLVFALVASFLWIVTTIYSIGYMRGNREAGQTRFYACFAVALGSAMGVAFSANLLTLFVFYEVLTLSTYPLVTHHGTEAARQGGRFYLGFLLSTSIGFLLPAMVWTWHAAGTLDFRAGGILAGQVGAGATMVLLALFAFGIGKAALMPFHRWLPAAMVAPTPVSALLHAVAVVKAGVFTVLKVVVYIFGVEHLSTTAAGDWLLYVAGATILIASLVALRQDNLKARLAYSTISQLSYVVLGAIILAPLSILGAALHSAVHAFGKITLFFAAGSIYTAAHKTEISQLDGIGRRMPWTMGAFAIGSLSMIGVPPAAGFISKWYILMGAVEAERMLAVGVIILSTALNAAYFMPIVYAAFFKPGDGETPAALQEAPVPVVAALVITALMTVLLFLYPALFLQLGRQMPAL